MHFELLFWNLKRETTDRTSVGTPRSQQVLAVKPKNSEDSLDRIGNLIENRLHNHRDQRLHIKVEDSKQQLFLGLEEVIEAARIRFRAFENLSDTGRRISL